MIDYNKLKKHYLTKRLKELATLFSNRNPIYDFNAAIIDGNQKKQDANKIKLELLGVNWEYEEFHYLRNKKKLTIAYLLPHNSLTGGLKILVEQADNLLRRGNNVLLYSHFPKPYWIDTPCKYIEVPPYKELYEEVQRADIIIAGYWDLIVDTMKTDIPIKYYLAQGDIDIFEYEKLQPFYRNTAFVAHQLPIRILTVSSIMKEKLKEIYGRESIVIPNAIDSNIFYREGNINNKKCEILIIGRDNLDFKGTGDIIKALVYLKEQGIDLRVKWISPTLPTKDYSPGKLNIQYHICPTPEELGRLYREADIYISGSYYESFSLPPLEAMMSGTVVLTAANDGVKEYAIDNKNCLMFKPGDILGMAKKLSKLISNKEVRDRLVNEGIKTAKLYTWKNSIDTLEKEILDYKKDLKIAFQKQ